MSGRKICSYCSQELSRTTFYRHLNDQSGKICPGKKRSRDYNDFPNPEDVTPTEKMPRNDSLDSSFDVNSDSCASFDVNPCDDEVWHDSDYVITASTVSTFYSSSESESDSDCASSSDIEIWDRSDIEDFQEEPNNSIGQVISAVSFFLVFFHLTYRISERAINTLVGFLRALFHFLSIMTGNAILTELSGVFPKTLHGARNIYKLNDFTEYAVCPKCNTIYPLKDCIDDGESKRCTFVEFPNHPHQSKRNACNEVLMKKIKVGNGQKLVPRKVYIYRSIINSLKFLARQKGFLEKCDHWRTRDSRGLLGDIYDGKLWHDLHTINGRPFLSLPNNLCLALNVDWFNPYKETQYSAGAIYLIVLNLPRHERFKEENVILVGMIPGPNEPKNHINTYLTPFVNDMKVLFSGIHFQNPSSLLGYTMLRATLACIVCDLPATRKVCGFANFNSKFGCSKCMKQFPTSSFGAKPDYSGYDWAKWLKRDIDNHRQKAIECKNATTNTERKKILQECGVKYSEIIMIPEFDIIRSHVIDPMHCLFLGLAKHTIQTWKEKGVLSHNKFKLLQEKVDSIIPPSKIGRIPRKVESGFASFTADEWKNWIVLYSIYALHGIIEEQHFKCWCLLVESCSILLEPVLSRSQIEEAHGYLINFCKSFELLYGSECCTPNMHMCCHIKDCLLDFGPLSAFWCFPYERYNGLLEGISKSWILPEKQMFLKFLGMQKIKQLSLQQVSDDNFEMMLYHKVYSGTEDYSSVGQTKVCDVTFLQRRDNCFCEVDKVNATKFCDCFVPPYKERCFSEAQISYLSEMYKLLYPTASSPRISRFYNEYKKCVINGEEYISLNSRSQRSCAIAAKWRGIRGIDPHEEAPVRIGQIISFIEHNIITNAESKTHLLAYVQWLGDHPFRHYFHQSVIICSTVPDDESAASFMPVSRIICRCALSSPLSVTFDFGLDRVYVSVPLSQCRD